MDEQSPEDPAMMDRSMMDEQSPEDHATMEHPWHHTLLTTP
jgi:hypothetical protein